MSGMVPISFKLVGSSQFIKALRKSEHDIYLGMRKFFKRERDLLIGSKNRTGKGYRELLKKKIRKRRGGKWTPGVVGQFKGYVNKPGKLNGLKMESGIFDKSSKLKKALVRMHFMNGTIKTRGRMVIPIYQNLKKIGYRGPFFDGSASKGMGNLAFKNLQKAGRLSIFYKRGKMYAYDKRGLKKRGGYKRNALLFYGTNRIKVRNVLGGRDSFIRKAEIRMGGVVGRGQTALNRVSRNIDRRRFNF